MHPEKDTAEAFLLRRAAKTGVPITGSFELTPRCNLNCKMCYVRMNRTEQEKINRLQTAEEWTALAEKLRDAGTLFLLFVLNWRLSLLVVVGDAVMFWYIRFSTNRSRFCS